MRSKKKEAVLLSFKVVLDTKGVLWTEVGGLPNKEVRNCFKNKEDAYMIDKLMSEKVQKDFINELRKTKFIIADKVEIENEFSPAHRLHYLKKHINKHYKEILSSYKFKVFKKIN